MVELTRRVTFNAAHKLYVEAWTPEQNREAFGKCSNVNWHGHNYELFITVKGHPHPVTGFVTDAKLLGDFLKREIVDQLDHSNLNLDIDWMHGLQPTSENLAIAIWRRLSPKLNEYLEATNPGCRLYKLRIVETENISVDYYGD